MNKETTIWERFYEIYNQDGNGTDLESFFRQEILDMLDRLEVKEKSNYWTDKEIKRLNAKTKERQWGIRGRSFGFNSAAQILKDKIKQEKELLK